MGNAVLRTTLYKTLEGSERAQVRSCVEQANQWMPRCWPLRTFIYRNPLQGLEHLPFHQATRHARELFGGQGYLSNDSYKKLYESGKITDASILEALEKLQWPQKGDQTFQIGKKRFGVLEVLKIHLIHRMESIDESIFHWRVRNEGILSRYRKDVPGTMRFAPEAERVSALWRGILTALDLSQDFKKKEEVSHDVSTPGLSKKGKGFGFFLVDLAKIGKEWTLGEWIQEMTGTPLMKFIDEQMIKWCSAYLDEGMASWGMPSRENGFYRAWLGVASMDRSGEIGKIPKLSEKIRMLPTFPEDTIAGCLTRLGIQNELWPIYLRRHLAQMPGWASFIKWRANEPDDIWQKHFPIDPTQYLAVRLFYETEGVEALCQRTWNIHGTVPELQSHFRTFPDAYPLAQRMDESVRDRQEHQRLNHAWRFFNLSQFLGLDQDDFRSLTHETVKKVVNLLDQLPPENHGPVWLEALELSYRKNLLEKLSSSHRNGTITSEPVPQAQTVFCIDARSEYLRRHLETLGPYQTFGFAGFFGVPICYRPYGSDKESLLCPALIKPKKKIFEAPRTGHEKEVEKNDARSKWFHSGHGIFHDLKANNLSAYILIDLLGGLFGLTFILKTFFPAAYQEFRSKLHDRVVPKVPTRLLLAPPVGENPFREEDIGFTTEEQVTLLENGLRLMGLTSHFAPIVFLCAHGSTSENNPYAAAYDCGACGGNHGGPTARALAAIGNNPEVRTRLKDRGIEIPTSTLFISGEHNTTTDEVLILDEEGIPPSHQAALSQLQKDLHQAGLSAAHERVQKLPGAPRPNSVEQASRHVRRRSGDWSQVRPEWGLSGNAAFIIGRRKLTQGIKMEGRVFMHSYDPHQDTTGNALETIMTAPLLVVQWISMEYYFSSTDPFVYGSASKVYHNVVSGIGVLVGRQSDLRPGLPMQSVMNGEAPFHEPMRPLTIIDAPVDRIQEIIHRHGILQTLFNNGWVNLIAWNPDQGSFQEYRGVDRWESVTVTPTQGTSSIFTEVKGKS